MARLFLIMTLCMSFVLQGAAYPFEEAATLGVHPFTRSLDPATDAASVIKAYLAYEVGIARKGADEFARLTRDDFPTRVVWNKRVVTTNFRRDEAGRRIYLSCSMNGSLFTVELIGGEREITIGRITPLAARPFPAAIPPLAVRFDAELPISTRIIRHSAHAVTTAERELLSRSVVRAFMAADKAGLYTDLEDAAAFLAGADGVPIDTLPLALWATEANDAIIERMLMSIRDASPPLAGDLAAICCAIGRIFYDTRSLFGYRRSEFFNRMAHRLDEGNATYHNEWAWAMKHCGMAEPARKEIVTLLDRDGENTKYLVELAHIDLDEADRRIKHLEARGPGTIPEDEALKETAALYFMLEDVTGIAATGRVDTYPRALSIIGTGYHLKARLHQFVLADTLARDCNATVEARRQAVAVAKNFQLGIMYVTRACALSGRTGEEVAHASRMADDVFRQSDALLGQWIASITAGGIPLANEIPILASCFSDAERDLAQAPGSRAGVSARIDQVNDVIIPLHRALPQLIRDEFIRCREEDIDHPERFIDRVHFSLSYRLIANDVFSSIPPAALEAIVRGYIEYYRKKVPLDKTTVAILYTYWNADRGEGPVPVSVIKAAAAPYLAGVTEAEIGTRLRKARAIFDLAVTEEAPEEDAAIPPTAAQDEDDGEGLIDRKVLADSVNRKTRNAFILRLERLDVTAIRCRKWDGEEGIGENYTGYLIPQLEYLKTREMAYRAKAVSLLDRSGIAKGREERSRLASDHNLLSGEYRRLRDDITRLEGLFAKRHDRITQIVEWKRAEIAAAIAEDRKKLAGVAFDWAEYQLRLLDECYDGISSVTEAGSVDTYFSHDTFVSWQEEWASVEYRLEQFGERIKTYKDLLEALDTAENETKLAAAYFEIPDGSAPGRAIAAFLDVITEARSEVFRHASEGREYSALPASSADAFSDILARATHCMRLRQALAQEVYAQPGEGLRRFGEAGVNEEKEIGREVETILKKEAMERPFGQTGKSLIEIYLDPNEAVISDDAAEGSRRQLTAKIPCFFLLKRQLSKTLWDTFTRKAEWMERTSPGVFDAGRRQLLSEKRQVLEALVTEVQEEELGSIDFYVRLNDLIGRANEANQDYLREVRVTYGIWWRRISREVAVMRELVSQWLEEIPGEPFTPAQKEEIVATFRKLEEAFLEEEEGGGENVAIMIHVILRLLSEPERGWSDINGVNTSLYRLYDRYGTSDYIRTVLETVEPEFFTQTPPGAHQTFYITPYFEDGIWKDFECYIIATSGGRFCSIAKFNVLETATRIPPPSGIARTVDAMREKIENDYNRYLHPDDAILTAVPSAHPQWLRQMIANVLGFFLDAGSLDSNPFCEGMPQIDSVAMYDLIVYATRRMEGLVAATARELSRNEAETVDTYRRSRDFYEEAARTRPLRPWEERMRGRTAELGVSMQETWGGGWYGGGVASRGFRGLIDLLERTTGRAYPDAEADRPPYQTPSFRPILAGVRGEPLDTMLPYPESEEYRGLSFDGRSGAFTADPFERGARSAQLAAALQESFTAFIDRLAAGGVPDDEDEDGEWRGHLETILSAIKNSGRPIRIVVTDDLPMNSLTVGDTVFFNTAFVEQLLARFGEGAAPRHLLGERIFHEFGHFANESKLAWCATEAERQIESEVAQVTIDAIFYERIFHWDHAFAQEIDRFVHTLDPAGGEKLSAAFGSAELYTHLQEFAALYHDGLDHEMAVAIREFVTRKLREMVGEPFPDATPVAVGPLGEAQKTPADLFLAKAASEATWDDVTALSAWLAASGEDAIDPSLLANIAWRLEEFKKQPDLAAHQVIPLYTLLADVYSRFRNYTHERLTRERRAALEEITAGATTRAGNFRAGIILRRMAGSLRARSLSVPDGFDEAVPEGGSPPIGARMIAYAEALYPSTSAHYSMEFFRAVQSLGRLSRADATILDGIGAKSAPFLEKNRVVVVSKGLIPECQRELIDPINDLSEKAVAQKRTNERIMICGFDEAAAMHSDGETEVVLVLEQGELARYTGTERRLSFERHGDGPVKINGLIAAGRALLYEDLARLRSILIELSGNPALALPAAERLAVLLQEGRTGDLARELFISLPASVRFNNNELAELNEMIVAYIQFA